MDKASNELKWIETSNTWSWIPHKKWGPCCLASPTNVYPIDGLKRKLLPWSSFHSIYTSPNLNLHYIIYICNCCLHSDNLHYPSNNHRSVKWTCYVYNSVASLRGIWFPKKACWNRWYRYPSRSRPFHPESQYVASTRRGLAATSPRPHNFLTHRAPSTEVSTEVKWLGVWNVTTFD